VFEKSVVTAVLVLYASSRPCVNSTTGAPSTPRARDAFNTEHSSDGEGGINPEMSSTGRSASASSAQLGRSQAAEVYGGPVHFTPGEQTDTIRY